MGGGGTKQATGADTLPEASVAMTDASPLMVMCQSMTPGPCSWLGVAPGAWVSLIFVPLAKGSKEAELALSMMVRLGFGSTASDVVSSGEAGLDDILA